MAQKELGVGWCKYICSTLEEYQLPTDFDTIKRHRPNEWKCKVAVAIENKNKERLINECHKTYAGKKEPKTKTKRVLDKLNTAGYNRKPEQEILQMTKLETRTLICARYGMLECGKNFGGTIGGTCSECNEYDDEEHRLNHCNKWADINYLNSSEKIDFNDVHSENLTTLRTVICKLQKVWNMKNAQGTMNRLVA